jgi:hypothetical protein
MCEQAELNSNLIEEVDEGDTDDICIITSHKLITQTQMANRA